MQNPLGNLLKFKTGETGLLLVLGFVIFSNALAQKVSEIASISNFLADVGPPQFLIVLILSSAVSLLMTGAQSLLVDRFDRVVMLRVISALLGIAFVVLRLMFLFHSPDWLNYGLFYLLSDQQLVFFPMAFWVLANDIFDIAQSKRLFPLLGSLSFMGNLTGIGVTALTPLLFASFSIKPEELLMVNILLYFLIYLVLDMGLRHIKLRKASHKPETMRETLMEGWNFVKEVPAFRYLTVAILSVIICETIVEFHFYTVSEAAFTDASHYQTFLSVFTLARTLTYIAIQTFLTQRIIAAIDLKNSFLIQPISGLLGTVCMMVMPGLGGGVAGLTLQKLPQYTIDETARKSFQGLVPEERRGRVSLFMDSYLFSGGIIIGSVVTGGVVLARQWLSVGEVALAAGSEPALGGFGASEGGAFYAYLAAGLIASLVALWATVKLRMVYDSSLLSWRLKRRQRCKSVLDRLDF